MAVAACFKYCQDQSESGKQDPESKALSCSAAVLEHGLQKCVNNL